MWPYRASEPGSIPAGVVRYFKVDRRDLVLLKFILEAYEGMSTLSTVDQTGVIIRLSIQGGFEEDVQAVLESVGAYMSLHEVTFEPKDVLHA